jgi:transposase
MRVYIGVDFHARQQTLCYLTTEDGEIHRLRLEHGPDDVGHRNIREFYSQFSGEVIVGIETGGYSQWFEDMLEELGHQVWVGDAGRIRRLAVRKQKNDKLDAAHILDLMVSGRFPRVHRRSRASSEILRQIGYRHKLVKMRTMSINTLRAIAIGAGLNYRGQMQSQAGRARLEGLDLSPGIAKEVSELLKLIDHLSEEAKRVEKWLEEQSANDKQVSLMRTQYGVGLLTALALVHTLLPVERFPNVRKVTAFVGLDPVEDSSGDRKRIGSISKAGSKILRFLLGEAGMVVVKKDPELKRFFDRLKKRRNVPKAKVAVARKLLVRSFIMLRDNIDAEEFHRRGVEARSSRVAHRPPSA